LEYKWFVVRARVRVRVSLTKMRAVNLELDGFEEDE
jgi:hypothetical protein